MDSATTIPWMDRQADETIGVGPYLRVGCAGAVAVLFVLDLPIRRFARHDVVSLRAEFAALESMGLLAQADLGSAGLVSEATFHRDCVAFREGGEDAVRARTVRGTRGPRKLLPPVLCEIDRLRKQGFSADLIALRLGMSRRAVFRALRERKDTPTRSLSPRSQSPEPVPETASASGVQAPCASEERVEEAEQFATAAVTIEAQRPAEDADECTRRIAQQREVEWTLARFGQIEEQSALFPPLAKARFGGVLLAMALLSVTGLLDQMRSSLAPPAHGLYGLRSIATTLIAMALLRCKRPEQLKGFDPAGLGAVVGLARAPEMKTLRRKLKALAADETAVVELGRAMAKRHIERVREAALATAIAAGGEHSCALRSDGSVRCWGRASSGQLGNGSLSTAAWAVPVQNLTGALRIVAGDRATCAQIASGWRCWGNNSVGQLGVGDTQNRALPSPDVGLPANRTLVFGENRACAYAPDGSVTCWGDNGTGLLWPNAATTVCSVNWGTL